MDIVGEKNLRHMWDGLAHTYGEKTALVFEDISGNTCEFTYADFNDEINRAANVFLGLGISKADRVVVQLYNSPEFLITWFGLAKIGAIMVPINVHYLQSECAHIIEKCNPRAVVIEESFLSIYESIQCESDISIDNILIARVEETRELPGVINFNKLLKQQSEKLDKVIPLSCDDVVEILYTSGTTSNPKGVVITHYNLLFAGRYTSWQCDLRSEDRYLTMMPAWHIDLQCTAAMPTFTVGATFILLEKYSASKFWNQVCCYRATITECIPLMVRTLMSQPKMAWEKNHCLREVFFYLNLSEQEKDGFVERFNVRLLTSYGMTESIVGILGDRPGDERRWPSIGKPGLCYEAKIIDNDKNEVPPNTIGEIYIKGVPGKTIFQEYYNEPEATDKVLDVKGWLHTGDKGYMDEDGYFYFVDRKSNLIKRSGENIASTEIENFLVSHPEIAEAVVVGIPDAICGEAVKAFIIVKEGAFLSVDEVIDYCTAHIAKFKVPSCVEIRTSFPRTCTGKVQKNILKNESVVCGGLSAIDDCSTQLH